MKKIIFFFFLGTSILIAQNYTSYFTGNPVDITTNPEFGICLMGGATESDDAMRWFLEKADGGDILVLRASGSNGYNNYFYTELGVTVNSVESIVIHNATGALDPYVLQKVSQAEAIWFAGGDQWNYVNYFKGNAMQEALNSHINVKQAVIGGTSAGMAILGSYYFDAQNGTVHSAQALFNPYDTRVSLGYNDFLEVPFMENVITDTHYDNPDRRGRHMTFMARYATDIGLRPFGIASEEFTAVCIEPDGKAYVYGNHPTSQDFAYFVQARCLGEFTPENCTPGNQLDWQRDNEAVKVYKVPGTTTGTNYFDLATWEIGEGGIWENWYVEDGTFFSVGSDPINCILIGFPEYELLKINYFPNPVKDVLTLESNEKLQVEVFTILGEKIMELHLENLVTIDFSKNTPGVYFIKAFSTSGSKTFKIVKN